MTAPPPTRTAARAAQVEGARARRAAAGRITPAMRRAVIERDGEKCRDCPETKNLQLDHLVPVARGGKTVLSNLVLRCGHDNASRGDLTRGEARTCPNCDRPFRRKWDSLTLTPHIRGFCTPCIGKMMAADRRLKARAFRKAASEAKRVKALAYRQASRRARRRGRRG